MRLSAFSRRTCCIRFRDLDAALRSLPSRSRSSTSTTLAMDPHADGIGPCCRHRQTHWPLWPLDVVRICYSAISLQGTSPWFANTRAHEKPMPDDGVAGFVSVSTAFSTRSPVCNAEQPQGGAVNVGDWWWRVALASQRGLSAPRMILPLPRKRGSGATPAPTRRVRLPEGQTP